MSEIVTSNETAPPAITEGPGALLAAVVMLAKDPAIDATKLQALLSMQERLEDRQAERAFAAALTAAQADMPQVERLGTVNLGPGKGSYAFTRLEDMDRVLRPIMIKHGFSIFFDREQREGPGGGLVVTGTLTHVGGHSKTASFPVALDTGAGRNNLQAAGSSDSYARRYILEGFFLIVRKGKDDDGVAAGTKFIDPEQVDELQALVKQTGRTEQDFMQSFSADTLHHFDELEPGTAFLAAKGALTRMARAKAQP